MDNELDIMGLFEGEGFADETTCDVSVVAYRRRQLIQQGHEHKNRMNAVNSYNDTQDVYRQMNALNDTQGTIDRNFDWANVNNNQNQNNGGTPWL